MTLEEGKRFWAKVDIGSVNACWPWLGAKVGKYGAFAGSDGEQYAHRVAFRLRNGHAAENDVLHSCDFGLCCNPRHLKDGTESQNMQDMVAKGRHRGGTHRLAPEQAKAIQADPRSQRQIAAAFGVAQSTVSRIKTGAYWRCLP